MKWLRTLLIDQGGIISSKDWQTVHDSYVRAIRSIDNPLGSGEFCLRRKVKLPNNQWQRNGVSYLRNRFLDNMQKVEGWHPEGNVDLGRDRKQPAIKLYPSLEAYREPITSDFGGFDFMTTGPETA